MILIHQFRRFIEPVHLKVRMEQRAGKAFVRRTSPSIRRQFQNASLPPLVLSRLFGDASEHLGALHECVTGFDPCRVTSE